MLAISDSGQSRSLGASKRNYLGGLVLAWFPVVAAELTSGTPAISWTLAWCGSILILLMTFKGQLFPLPTDLPLRQQSLRPWFIVQLIFSGYTFLTPVFYWLDLNGISFGLSDAFVHTDHELGLAAEAQRIYLVAHVGMIYGFALYTKKHKQKNEFVWQGDVAKFLLTATIVALFLSFTFAFIPGFGQFAVKATQFSIVAVAVSLGVAFYRHSSWVVVCALANVFLLFLALSSGWKEEVLVLTILVAAIFFTKYPYLTSSVLAVMFVAGAFILPTFAASVRVSSWYGEKSRVESLLGAIDEIQQMSWSEISLQTWKFLKSRVSEAELFTLYLEKTPEVVDYEGLNLVKQTLLAPVPRILWSGKPDLEKQAMQRTKARGVVGENATVSAKPQFVVDGFLAGGAFAVFFSMLVYGWICQYSYWLCESRFGGYLIGGVVFNGLFGILWRGNCWEFMANTLIWSFVFVYVLDLVFRSCGFLVSRNAVP